MHETCLDSIRPQGMPPCSIHRLEGGTLTQKLTQVLNPHCLHLRMSLHRALMNLPMAVYLLGLSKKPQRIHSDRRRIPNHFQNTMIAELCVRVPGRRRRHVSGVRT